MAVNSLELWQRIVAEGLASNIQCRSWATEVAELLSAQAMADGLQVLQKLIELQKLTKYQAKILAGQSSDLLKRSGWHILGRVKHPIWNGWYRITKIDPSKAQQLPVQWAKWISAADMQRMEDSEPSLPRGIQLANLRIPHLQVSEIPELSGGSLLLRVQPPQGESLTDLFYRSGEHTGTSESNANVFSTDQVLTIIRQCTEALSALHDQRLYHGRMTPDRIYWDNRTGVTLLCDPIAVSTLRSDPSETGTLGTQLPESQSYAFLSPEFLAPMHSPSATSDVYALGVTWWWLMAGQPPYVGSTLTETLKLAAHQGLDHQRQQLNLSDPLWRCLMHCLAKNPTARFSNATQLLRALEVAQQQIANDKIALPFSTSTERVMAPAESKATQVDQEQAIPAVSLTSAKAIQRPLPQTIPRRKNRKPNWLLPSLGACVSLLTMLLILRFSGILDSRLASSIPDRNSAPRPAPQRLGVQSEPTDADPLADFYRVADSERLPWAPPQPPAPISLDMLPSGAQLYLSLRPAQWMAKRATSDFIKILQRDFDLDQLLEPLTQPTGLKLDDVAQLTLAYYPPSEPDHFPQYVMRVQLVKPMTIGQLESKWPGASKQRSASQSIWMVEPDLAIYLPGISQNETQFIEQFSLGSQTLLTTLGDTHEPARLSPQMKQLHQRSSGKYDLTILGVPRFLFSDGRGLAEQWPQRLLQLIEEQLGKDGRAALVQLHVADSLYWEMLLVGASDGDAPRWSSRWNQRASAASNELESWLVEHNPHEYWRGLAVRMPQMLRVWQEFARFGVEDGAAIANGYLPSESLSGLLIGCWLALQQFNAPVNSLAQPSGGVRTGDAPSAPLTTQQFLQRRIRLSFAQEPIERALALVGEEANEGLLANSIGPASSQAWRFVLDGSAFERSGITRNQQLRDFEVRDQSVRQALTEIAKRGNPVTTVKDTRDNQQQLIWVVKDDDQQPGQPMVLLTTRSAAEAAGWQLPEEFTIATSDQK